MTHEWKVPENLQRSMSFLRKFVWTLLHVPPHPSPPHPCIHAPNGSHRKHFLRKFTWTLLHACPPTPPVQSRAYMHLPAATDKHVLPPQVHMNVITCPTPPHPTPDVYKTPRPSKGRGPTSLYACVYIYIILYYIYYILIYILYIYIIYIYIYILYTHTHTKIHICSASKVRPVFPPRSVVFAQNGSCSTAGQSQFRQQRSHDRLHVTWMNSRWR